MTRRQRARLRARLLVIAALSGATVFATTGTGPAMASPSRAFPATGRVIQRLDAANMTRFTGGQAQAVALARAYDVLIANPGEFGSYLPAMRAANRGLIILGYLNGTFAQHGQPSTFPDAWYLRDAAGDKVTSRGWGNYAMDPANSGWVNSRVHACTQIVAEGYDGCMLDMLGDSATQPGYVNGLPVNPATHRRYTAEQWLTATGRLGAGVAGAVSPKLVAGNGLGSGVRYFDPVAPSSQLYNGIRAALAEAWLRPPNAPAGPYPSEAAWKASVDALVNAGQRGDVLVALTKVWGGGSPAQISAWHLLSLASFLLGTNGTAYYEFSSSNTESGILNDSPWEHLDVGLPTGPYSRVGAVFERTFTRGLVLVNPTRRPAQVLLPRPLCDANGSRHRTVTLGPDGADIFTRC